MTENTHQAEDLRVAERSVLKMVVFICLSRKQTQLYGLCEPVTTLEFVCILCHISFRCGTCFMSFKVTGQTVILHDYDF